jgi:RimJ/RimL family protein N-acetyltransferase
VPPALYGKSWGGVTLIDDLYQPLTSGDLSLMPIAEAHREGLRAACAEDHDIWQIYPSSFEGEHFDPAFDALLNPDARLAYAIHVDGVIIGMTAWHDFSASKRTTYIGNSFIVPRLRGTGLNTRIKHLMIDHGVACGFRRIGFMVDARNTRSQRAVEKLGALREGVLRAERVTWTGHVRDTVVFSILAGEWAGLKMVQATLGNDHG